MGDGGRELASCPTAVGGALIGAESSPDTN
jgi:hypothetical protein